MKIITQNLLDGVAFEFARQHGGTPKFHHAEAEVAVRIIAPVVVRKAVRELNAHHDDFIDGHSGAEYFALVDEILAKVSETLRELIAEEDNDA
jgi:hypothetical protein